MRNNQGFTLIEIMIVIVIVGITFGFALIAFGDFGESKRVMFAAEQLVNTLRIAQQQAIFETSTLGMRIDNNGYQVLQLQNNGQWNATNTGIFKMYYFPKNTVITLRTENPSRIGLPPIVIQSSGDITPFTLSFGTSKDHQITSLTASRNGTLSLRTEASK